MNVQKIQSSNCGTKPCFTGYDRELKGWATYGEDEDRVELSKGKKVAAAAGTIAGIAGVTAGIAYLVKSGKGQKMVDSVKEFIQKHKNGKTKEVVEDAVQEAAPKNNKKVVAKLADNASKSAGETKDALWLKLNSHEEVKLHPDVEKAFKSMSPEMIDTIPKEFILQANDTYRLASKENQALMYKHMTSLEKRLKPEELQRTFDAAFTNGDKNARKLVYQLFAGKSKNHTLAENQKIAVDAIKYMVSNGIY